MELQIRPNPCPQEEGAHRYRLLLTAPEPVRITGVTGRILDPGGREVWRQEWDPRELFGVQDLAPGETAVAPRLSLGRFTGGTAEWAVRGVTAGGDPREAVARVALTLPPGTGRVIFRRQPDREAVVARPAGAGGAPALILIHGSESHAASLAWLAGWAARRGYVAVALSQPGFGGSEGEPDFAGPGTVAALQEGYAWVRSLPEVDPDRIGLWGVSRGAVAAANLATAGLLPGLRALVLQAGAYDLLAPELEGLRQRLLPELGAEREAGPEEALRRRSALYRAERIPCPVLLLHGDRDEVIPESQSRRLAERLRALGKPCTYRCYPGRGHFLPARRVWEEAIFPFLDELLRPGAGSGPRP
ncbi:MAG: prolyl oligopeptidase family serine peptidase [Firmicutes bacterium]|nr:prolyl oligopeptidase family serine peptidase [Bacillota bacterium]